VAFAKMERGVLVKRCWIYLGRCAVVAGWLVGGAVVLVSGGYVAVVVAVIGFVFLFVSQLSRAPSLFWHSSLT